MAQSGNGQEQNPLAAPPKQILHEIVIRLWSNGELDVTGMPNAAITAYGLLGMAQEVILRQRLGAGVKRPLIEVPRNI